MRQLIMVQPELRQGWQRTDVWRLQKKLKLTKNWVQVKFVWQISYSPQMVQVRVGVLGLKIGFWPEKGVKVKKS